MRHIYFSNGPLFPARALNSRTSFPGGLLSDFLSSRKVPLYREPLQVQRQACASTGKTEPQTLSPRVNLLRAENQIYLQVLLPGLKLESLDLEADEREISLQGELFTPMESQQSRFFQRTIKLPVEVDLNTVRAEYAHGLLHVHAQLAPEKIVRKITLRQGE